MSDWENLEESLAQDKRFRIILCGASAYDEKYYFNQKFDALPESVKEELHIICVLFTEEVGGVFTIGFTPTGEVLMDSVADEGDLLYDEIGSALLMKKIRSSKQEVFESLSIYFKVQFLHMDPSALLTGWDEEPEESGEEEEEPEEEEEVRRVFRMESGPGDVSL